VVAVRPPSPSAALDQRDESLRDEAVSRLSDAALVSGKTEVGRERPHAWKTLTVRVVHKAAEREVEAKLKGRQLVAMSNEPAVGVKTADAGLVLADMVLVSGHDLFLFLSFWLLVSRPCLSGASGSRLHLDVSAPLRKVTPPRRAAGS